MQLSFFIHKIKNVMDKVYQSFIIHWLDAWEDKNNWLLKTYLSDRIDPGSKDHPPSVAL